MGCERTGLLEQLGRYEEARQETQRQNQELRASMVRSMAFVQSGC